MRSDVTEAYGLTMEQTPKLGAGVFPTLTVRTYKDPSLVCFMEERMTPDDDVIAVTGDHAHACITVGGGEADGNRDFKDRIRVYPLARVAPALCRSDYKGFTRTQNILDGCAYLVVEEVYG